MVKFYLYIDISPYLCLIFRHIIKRRPNFFQVISFRGSRETSVHLLRIFIRQLFIY